MDIDLTKVQEMLEAYAAAKDNTAYHTGRYSRRELEVLEDEEEMRAEFLLDAVRQLVFDEVQHALRVERKSRAMERQNKVAGVTVANSIAIALADVRDAQMRFEEARNRLTAGLHDLENVEHCLATLKAGCDTAGFTTYNPTRGA